MYYCPFKAQADQRAMALKEELNRRRRDLQERLENERQSRELQVYYTIFTPPTFLSSFSCKILFGTSYDCVQQCIAKFT